jgi:hypothetical protein
MKRFIFVMYYVQVVVVFFFGLKGENMFAWRKHKAFIGKAYPVKPYKECSL